MNAKTLVAAAVAVPILMTGFAAAPASATTPVASTASIASVKATKSPAKKRKAAKKRASRAAGVSMRTRGTRFSPTTAAKPSRARVPGSGTADITTSAYVWPTTPTSPRGTARARR